MQVKKKVERQENGIKIIFYAKHAKKCFTELNKLSNNLKLSSIFILKKLWTKKLKNIEKNS